MGINRGDKQRFCSFGNGVCGRDVPQHFENAIQDVRDTESNLQTQQYLLATGQIDNPHSVQIAASEAQLSTSMLVQLRNKALDSYNELMRISL